MMIWLEYRYDTDGSGELDLAEFSQAVRKECQLSARLIGDGELREIFDVIDVDHSGGIDAVELQVISWP